MYFFVFKMYSEFLVIEKFNLADDVAISLEDEQGAEVDEEVFPVLWEVGGTPNITFSVRGEDSNEISLIQDAATNPQVYYCNIFISFDFLMVVNSFNAGYLIIYLNSAESFVFSSASFASIIYVKQWRGLF